MAKVKFAKYLKGLQKYHGMKPVMDLIRDWNKNEMNTVSTSIKNAVMQSGVIGKTIPTFDFNSSNQSKGNQVADFFIATINQHFPRGVQIETMGGGYPDAIFTYKRTGYCLELKATTHWDETDSNRRVLTSSPNKLRELINSQKVTYPPAHFIATLIYDDATATIAWLRFDFLHKNFLVNERHEASTSQRDLATGGHNFFLIP